MPARVRSEAYTFQQLTEWVQGFHREHGRVPTTIDIKELSKKGLAPSTRPFMQKGGLNWVIKNAGLEVKNRNTHKSAQEVISSFRKYIKEFRENNNNRWPSYNEYVAAATQGKCSSLTSLKTHTKRTYKELLEWLGKPPRRM